MRAGVDPTTATGLNTMTPAQQQREIQRQAREMAAAQKAAERERKAQEKAAARRRAGPAEVDRQRHPDRRQGRLVAARPGPHPRASSGRCSAAARAAEARSGRDAVRPGSTRLGGPAAHRRGSQAAAGAARPVGQRAGRAAARPAVVDGDADPDRSRASVWFKATGPGPRLRGPAARGLPRARRRRGSCCRWRVHPSRAVAAVRRCGADAARRPGRTATATTTWRRGSGSCPSTPACSGRSRARRRWPRCWPPACPTDDPSAWPASWRGSWPTTGSGSRVAGRRAGRGRTRPRSAAARRPADRGARRRRCRRPGSRPRSSTTTCTAGTSWSGRTATGSSTGATRSSRIPFATLTVTFNSIAHHTGRTLDDPAFARLRDAYLEAWTDVAPRDEL